MTTEVNDLFARAEVTDREIKIPKSLWIDALANPEGWVRWGLAGEPGKMKTLALAYRVVDGAGILCTDGWEAVREGLLIKGFKR